jgi:hypothetical protein
LALLLVSAGAAQDGRVIVLYPAGACRGGRLQLEVFERGVDGKPGQWKPHPTHATIAPDSCQSEDPGILLNELRIRCVDAEGKVYSGWILGVDLSPSGLHCPES